VPAAFAQPQRVRRIGVLIDGARRTAAEALLSGMKQRGYAEGDSAFEVRYATAADGSASRRPNWSSAESTRSSRISRRRCARRWPPPRPSRSSWPRPARRSRTGWWRASAGRGGNVTGVTNMAPSSAAARLQLLKDMTRPRRVGVLVSTHDAFTRRSSLTSSAATAAACSSTRSPSASRTSSRRRFAAGRAAGRSPVDPGRVQLPRTELVALAARHACPHVVRPPRGRGGRPGVLCRQYRRHVSAGAATCSTRCCAAARPGELPVEQPSVFELV
jgi:hypothetical protein